MGVATNMDDTKPSAKAAHVNMMTDTIIANIPPEGLRSIMRGMLGGDPKIVSSFHNLASTYLASTRPAKIPALFTGSPNSPEPTSSLSYIQSRYRCLMGCGYGFESMELLIEVLQQIHGLQWDESTREGEDFMDTLAVVDGDLVQAVTAVQKTLLTPQGVKPMSIKDAKVVAGLKEALSSCQASASIGGQSFAFERGLSCLDKLINSTSQMSFAKSQNRVPAMQEFESSKIALESFQLGTAVVPRIFMGLWQFSSPAWGTASRLKIDKHFRQHVDAGLIAYGMSLKELEPCHSSMLKPCRYGRPLWRC
jgi:hypothetical protein